MLPVLPEPPLQQVVVRRPQWDAQYCLTQNGSGETN
jgi:hypothetical protein